MTTTSTVLTVSELTNSLKNLLETRFSSVCIQGEITNFKPNSSGHLYFDLKDSGAKISVVMFKNAATTLQRLPKEGDQVIIKGAISVYQPHGKYQLIAHSMQFAGLGALLVKLEELKKKLKGLGWFESERKRPLPKFPKCVGVVTSPTGAVIRDIINVMSRRWPGCRLILYPVKVQGTEAAAEIALAIDEFNKYNLADVLIVGRGGGSLEDLWPFNEEIVASAIYRSTLPIISAVGHETDFTLADFVADVRAPTPSAAAELVTAETANSQEFVKKMKVAFLHSLAHQLKRTREILNRYRKHPLISTPYALTGPYFQQVDDFKKELDQKILNSLKEKRLLLQGARKILLSLNPKQQLVTYKERLSQLEKRLEHITKHLHEKRLTRLKQIVQTLSSLDPKNVLKRGYSILFAIKNGSVIVSAHEISPGDGVRAQLGNGEINLKVVQGDE